MQKKNQWKDQSTEELKALHRDLSKEIFDLKNELSVNRKLEKPHLLRGKKRECARICTAINQRGTHGK